MNTNTGHGSQTRQDWKVVWNDTLGLTRVDWFRTKDAAENSWIQRKGLKVISVTLETHILDF